MGMGFSDAWWADWSHPMIWVLCALGVIVWIIGEML